MCLEMFGDDISTVKKVIPYTGLKLWFTLWFLRRVIKQETWGHGIGRHTPDEVWSIAVDDMTAISSFLGKGVKQSISICMQHATNSILKIVKVSKEVKL